VTYRLLYVSRAKEPDDARALRAILATSRRNNMRLGISGALCLVDGVYMQCLEGDMEALQRLYHVIARDARHQCAKLLSFEKIHKRNFDGWPLAWLPFNAEALELVDHFTSGQGNDLYHVNGEQASTLMLALSRAQDLLEA